MGSGPSRHAAGIGLAAGAAISFGTLAISAKLAYRAGAEAVPLLGVRFAIAALLLAAVAAVTRPKPPRRRAVAGLLALGAIGYAFESALFFAALERAPAGVVGIVFYSFPLMTGAAAVVLGLERLRASLVAALVLGSAGVAVVFSVSATGLAGPLLALAAAAAVAVYMLVAQVVTRGVDPVASGALTAAGAAAVLLAVAAASGTGVPAAALPWAGALGLATAVAFTLLYAAIARIGSARTAIAAMLEPVTTVALAAATLGERITTRVLIGAVLVVSALPMLAATKPEEPSAPPPDTL